MVKITQNWMKWGGPPLSLQAKLEFTFMLNSEFPEHNFVLSFMNSSVSIEFVIHLSLNKWLNVYKTVGYSFHPHVSLSPHLYFLVLYFNSLNLWLWTIISFRDDSIYFIKNNSLVPPNWGLVLKIQVSLKLLHMQQKDNLNFIQFIKSSHIK